MAAYPSIGLMHDIGPHTKRRVSISDAGTIRSVDLNEGTVFEIKITHPLVNATDRDTLLAFYVTNKDNVNTITLAGDTYDTHYTADYSIKSDSASYFTLETVLIGTRQ